MKPLIPKVRIGDVLRGTRNLRRWLRAACQYTRASDTRYGNAGKHIVRPYTPSKSEEYLVIINAWDVFAAACLEKEIVLYFQNSPTKVPRGMAPRRYMDPTIFPNWFIRTDKKTPRLSQWPNYAVYLWASIHLNLGHPECIPPMLAHVDNTRGPFCMAKDNTSTLPRRDLLVLLHRYSVKGCLRNNAIFHCHSLSGHGPRLEDIPVLERDTQELCNNPRIKSLLEKEDF